MWSGLLPPGATESDLSSDGEGPSTDTAVPESCVTKFVDLQRRRSEQEVSERRPRQRRPRQRTGKRKQRPPEEQNGESTKTDKMAALDRLQGYFGVDDRLNPPVSNKVMRKSRLEQNLDEALNRGDIEKAEELSDSLATREIAVKITKAAAYHRHMKAKEEPQSSQDTATKTKPPAWGFEAKKRWETKSNMGYM
ncbi:protein FAM204A isoform X2 [Ranitomeya imitator]|uniref:protein FAM204A isoform X2 n=1 Tax=Ranitomeya imitator TaxID=111125 RepID=UPI0037E91CCE